MAFVEADDETRTSSPAFSVIDRWRAALVIQRGRLDLSPLRTNAEQFIEIQDSIWADAQLNRCREPTRSVTELEHSQFWTVQ